MCDKQRLNLYRLSRLLLEASTDTLRCFFEKLYSPQGDLQSFLKINKKRIKSLCQQNIITHDQKEILKPSNGTLPLLSNLDITLLCILLRNLCHHQVGKPQCGWAGEPDDKDLSTGADILRLRKTRNKLYAHRKNAMVTDSDFQEIWVKTCGVISRLLSHLDQKLQEDIQSNIEEISKAQIDPETMYKLFDILFNQALCEILYRIGDPQPDHTALEDAYHDGDEEAETEMAEGYDGIICLIKLYPDLKSNMTRPSLTAIAKRLLDKKMISEDGYEQLIDATKPRRYLTDMLLKKILRVDPEKTALLKCFYNRLRIHHPAMATKISQIVVTEADRTAFRQVKQYGVVGKNAYMTSQNSRKMTDTEILFFERCLCENQECVDRINDELLSKFLISISDHSLINQSDKKISTLFKMVQLYSLDVESVLEHVLEKNMLEEWKKVRCEVPVTAALHQVMQDDGHMMKDAILTQEGNKELYAHRDHINVKPRSFTEIGGKGDDSNTPITPEHMNHARFCVALVTVCGHALKDILLTNVPVPYTDIYQAILANKVKLTGRQGRPLLNADQAQLVFPDPQGQKTGTVNQFDLSLLYTLIRNVSTVPAPITGWGRDPQDQPRDRSLGASVERIRSYRNHIIGFSPDGKVSQQVFENYWNKLEAVLHDIEAIIGTQVYTRELERQKRHVISVYDAC